MRDDRAKQVIILRPLGALPFSLLLAVPQDISRDLGATTKQSHRLPYRRQREYRGKVSSHWQNAILLTLPGRRRRAPYVRLCKLYPLKLTSSCEEIKLRGVALEARQGWSEEPNIYVNREHSVLKVNYFIARALLCHSFDSAARPGDPFVFATADEFCLEKVMGERVSRNVLRDFCKFNNYGGIFRLPSVGCSTEQRLKKLLEMRIMKWMCVEPKQVRWTDRWTCICNRFYEYIITFDIYIKITQIVQHLTYL